MISRCLAKGFDAPALATPFAALEQANGRSVRSDVRCPWRFIAVVCLPQGGGPDSHNGAAPVHGDPVTFDNLTRKT